MKVLLRVPVPTPPFRPLASVPPHLTAFRRGGQPRRVWERRRSGKLLKGRECREGRNRRRVDLAERVDMSRACSTLLGWKEQLSRAQTRRGREASALLRRTPKASLLFLGLPSLRTLVEASKVKNTRTSEGSSGLPRKTVETRGEKERRRVEEENLTSTPLEGLQLPVNVLVVLESATSTFSRAHDKMSTPFRLLFLLPPSAQNHSPPIRSLA